MSNIPVSIETTQSYPVSMGIAVTTKASDLSELDVTENGTYTASDGHGYNPVVVNVTPNLQSKTATPTESIQAVSPDDGYYGLSEVEVGAISKTYVGSEVPRRTSSDLTSSGPTVSAPAGYYETSASKSVASATQAMPSISFDMSGLITATSTQEAGYISAGTKTATEQMPTQSATTINPTESEQTAVTAGKFTTGAVKVGAISSGYVGSGITRRSSTDLTASGATVTVPSGYYEVQASKSVSTTTHPKPTISVNESGLITASHTQATGYVTGGTTTETSQLSIQDDKTVTPTKSSQIAVESGKYTTGTIIVDPIPSQYIVPSGTKQINSNGTHDVTEYASAEINVTEVNNQSKTVSPSESQQTVTYDSGYTGLEEVTVNAISSTYVGSGITRRSSSDLSASGATVTTPAGYYASQATKLVASGTAGTPTASKGTVSNHSVSVTPSVTNTTGYISGGTKTGTAVSVSASELVSGSETKTDNGTYDVTNLESLVVDIPFVTYYTGSGAPSSSLGSNGDIYLDTSGSGGGGSGGSSEIQFGTFTVTSGNPAPSSYAGFITLVPTTSSTVGGSNLIPLDVYIDTTSTTNPETKTGQWFIDSDGYMYVTFWGATDRYTPTVTATSGTAELKAYAGYLQYYNGYAHRTGVKCLYKISVGAELTLTYYDNN